MAIPAYLWLKDDGGADIKGSVDVQKREGSIEMVALEHSLYIPTDNNTLFLIARAIWRDGHEGRPILATLEEKIDRKFETEWYDQLFEATIDELNKYFN